MTMPARLTIIFGVVFLFALAAAGGAPNAFAQDAPETCEYLTEAADNHTCQHGDFGPFASVGSAPYPGDTPTSNVSTAHVLYTVALSGESGDNQSAVLFQPSNSGTYAFYMNEAYPLELLDAEGQAVPLRLENDVSACPQYLGWFHVYEDLEAGQTYMLVVGPNENAFIQVAVEVLAVFRETLYVDADRDSYGTLGQSMRTWCGVAAGYSSVSGDCNDGEPDIFPGAEETCNGADDNCDGFYDEDDAGLCEESERGTLCASFDEVTRCGCQSDDDCSAGISCSSEGQCETPASGSGGEGGASSAPTSGGDSSLDDDDMDPDPGADKPGEPNEGGAGADDSSPGGQDFAGALEASGDDSASGGGCSCSLPTQRTRGPVWLLFTMPALLLLRGRGPLRASARVRASANQGALGESPVTRPPADRMRTSRARSELTTTFPSVAPTLLVLM